MDLYRVQKSILQKARIDSRKVSAWIYNDQSIVFGFLLNGYFVSISYTVLGQTFGFIERNKSKVSKISNFSKFLKYISEVYGGYPRSANQINTVLSFRFTEADWAKIEAEFSKILEVTSIYFGSKLCYALNVERDNGINLAKYLDKPEVKYTGIQGNSNEFFLSYTRDHGLNDYAYELDNKGFLAVERKMGVSMFRHVNRRNYKDLLAYFPDPFHELENVIYTVEAPRVLSASKKNLLVLFSYTNKSNENMVSRYYSHPFLSVSNNIMPSTYVIRMANVSGAFGSHGLNTKFDENAEANIQNFIKSLINIYSVGRENVAICDASSGGAGAVYHGLTGGYKTFVIDPFLGNHEYYGSKDPLYLHPIYTPIGGIFKRLSNEIDHNLENQIVISSAKISEFYPGIKELKKALPTITLCEFDFEKTQKHLDFSGNTVFLSNIIINNLLSGIHITNSDVSLN